MAKPQGMSTVCAASREARGGSGSGVHLDRRQLIQGGLGAGCAAMLPGCVGAQEAAGAKAASDQEGRFITVDGVRLHAIDIGAAADPRDPVLILIHGAGVNLRDWTYQLTPRLEKHARIMAFDRPGFGLSERPEKDAASPIVQANLIWRAAVEMGMKRAIVVGHSFGGAVAMAMALEHPKTTAGLVVISGATMSWEFDETLDYLGGGINTAAKMLFSDKKSSQIALEKIFEPQAPDLAYAQHVGLTKKGGLNMWDTASDLNALNAYLDDMDARYGEVTQPLTLIHGTRDKIVPFDVHAARLHRQLKQSELITLEGVGHMAHQARPAYVVKAILDMLAADRAAR
ncbi:MAG: alpha/beta hydrolase [Neomegalonema sp.]|nr:alpha/beta hydrolase [Neomegalonema sp.]